MNGLCYLARAFNDTALTIAARNHNKEIVELLLRQEGIGINIQGILNQNIHSIQIYLYSLD